jgi:hypothetical protein
MSVNTNAVTPAPSHQAIDIIVELWPLKVAIMLWGKPGAQKRTRRACMPSIYPQRAGRSSGPY